MYKIYLVLNKNLKKITFWSQNFSTRKETYYDILKIRQNCTPHEIRNAFLKLSKKYHPDASGVSNTSQKDTEYYLRIMEAYQILSKRHSRIRYDQTLGYSHHLRTRSLVNNQTVMHHANTSRYNDIYNKHTGQLKFSNLTLVLFLIAFTLSGIAIEFFLIKNSVQLDRDRLDLISKQSTEAHAALRAQASELGNEKQLELMSERARKAE